MTTVHRAIRQVGISLARAEHALLVIALILTAVTAGIGLTQLANPESYLAARGFTVTYEWRPIQQWGAIMLALALATVTAIPGGRRTLALALCGQSLIWTAWGFSLIQASARLGTVPSGAIVYTGLSWALMIFAAYYWLTRKKGPVLA